ncbi:hypothetical protein WR25_03390 [Diploscapter pachys]|uniref:Uncharacterized protein n=1 Tax=Diploscapter pachys TaxID=2018661 RepID=A0A2A2M2R8_9BILA|nr:hypothetical protein WR25_03390 [Diploscapter pachys]
MCLLVEPPNLLLQQGRSQEQRAADLPAFNVVRRNREDPFVAFRCIQALGVLRQSGERDGNFHAQPPDQQQSEQTEGDDAFGNFDRRRLQRCLNVR